MAVVKRKVVIGQEPTEEQIARINEAASFPISFDEDCPKLTEDELKEFLPAHPEYFRPRKQQISIKLDADVLAALRAGGKGYQTRINAILRRAVENGEVS